MTYKPTSYHRQNAKDLGVKIAPSKAKGKKLQVELPDGKVKQIGAKGYNDYQLFKQKEGTEVANARRDNYRARHRCHNAKRYTAQHLACEILWADRKKGVLRGK